MSCALFAKVRREQNARMRVMVFGTFDASVHPRVGILVEGLQRQGVDVVVVNAPLGHDDAGPTRPPRHRPGVPRTRVRHARCLVELAARARRAPRPDVVLCGYQGRLDIRLARRLFPRVPLVLDHLESVEDAADRTTGEVPPATGLAARAERAAVRMADLVLVDTEEHRLVLPEEDRARAVVAPIGAAPPWFDAGRNTPGGGREDRGNAPDELRVVSFGWYSPVHGAPVIGEALRELEGFPVSFTMVGRGLELRRTREAAGPSGQADWRTWVPSAELPSLVAAHDVCLGIFGTGAKALRLVPNKVFQGAAAGCAVVTSDTAPQRRLLEAGAVLVPPGDPGALADALRRLAGEPDRVRRLRAEAAELARARFSPQAVVEPLLERLEAMAGKTARG
jgi:glycosyltransferase involved in cell wall biosynthesis